jgi:hypothetical protein
VFLRRLTQRDRRDYREIEQKQRTLAQATQKWLSLLRDMEHAGQSGEARYEDYFRAYLEAKERQKRIDLELFNLRHGLSG